MSDRTKDEIALGEADFIFDSNNWECTWNADQLAELMSETELGEIVCIGRMKSLPDKYALSVETDDGFEIEWFDTHEEAVARKKALSPKCDGENHEHR
jgi:hypothetical protein